MIIDFHTHTFPDRIAVEAVDKLKHASHMEAYTDGMESTLKSSMEKAGVDISVVLPVATYSGQAKKINDTIIEKYADGVNNGLLSLGAMHPGMDEPESELERLAAAGIAGIKLHPQYQETDFDDVKTVNILKKCAELGLLVVTHTGLDIGIPGAEFSTPTKCARAVEKANSAGNDVKIILAHMGGWFNWDEVASVYDGLPVYFDTAFSFGDIRPLSGEEDLFEKRYAHMLTGDEFRDLARKLGTDRIVFGSDSPWSDQSEAIGLIRTFGFTDEESEAILAGNAMRFLRGYTDEG